MRGFIWFLMGAVVLFLFWPSGKKEEAQLPTVSVPAVTPGPAPLSPSAAVPLVFPDFPTFVPAETEPLVLSQSWNPSVSLPGQVFVLAQTGEVPPPFKHSSPSGGSGIHSPFQPPHLRGETPLVRRRR